MDKQKYFNSIIYQVLEFDKLALDLHERYFDVVKLCKALPIDIAKKIRRIIITGCGDSYSAAGAMKYAIRELSGIYDCNSPDAVDFCRYYSDSKILKQYSADEVLVIAISFSGNSNFAVEALKRASSIGTHSLAITNNSNSKCSLASECVMNLEIPKGCDTPGLRSYFASLLALSAIGAYLGKCNQNISDKRFQEFKEKIRIYLNKFINKIPEIDSQMFEVANAMKNLEKFELIADWNEGFSAQFIEQKFIECGGVFCDHTTSEEFAHISFFHRNPDTFGMVVLINEDDPSLNRMIDSIGGCLAQHRPTLVITDANPEIFIVNDKNIDISLNFYGSAELGENAMEKAIKPFVCKVPTPPERWMSPLMDFIPGALLASYHAAINEKLFFAGRYDFRNQTWVESI